jgi:hypothetical protein
MAKAREAGEGEKGWLAEGKAIRVDPKDKRTVKKGPHLSPYAAKKLANAALVEEMDEGAVLEGLIRANLSGYKAYGPGRKGAGDDEAPPEEEE